MMYNWSMTQKLQPVTWQLPGWINFYDNSIIIAIVYFSLVNILLLIVVNKTKV